MADMVAKMEGARYGKAGLRVVGGGEGAGVAGAGDGWWVVGGGGGAGSAGVGDAISLSRKRAPATPSVSAVRLLV